MFEGKKKKNKQEYLLATHEIHELVSSSKAVVALRQPRLRDVSKMPPHRGPCGGEAETEPVRPLKLKNIYYLSSTTNVATPVPSPSVRMETRVPPFLLGGSVKNPVSKDTRCSGEGTGCRQATQRLLLNVASSIHLGPGSGTRGETCQGPVRWRNGAVSLEESEAQGCLLQRLHLLQAAGHVVITLGAGLPGLPPTEPDPCHQDEVGGREGDRFNPPSG